MEEAAEPGAVPRTPFPASRVLGFGLPLVAGMGGHALFNLADLWIVGGLGSAAITAVTISSMVNSVAMVVMQGVTDGSVALVARAVGAGDDRRAGAAARQAILLALAFGVLLGVPPWFWARELVAAFGVEGAALEQGTVCLRIMSLGSVTMFLLMQAGAALRALGSGKAPAALLVGANLLNLFLAVGLVYGKFGLPTLGVAGACWGTVLARGVLAGVGLWLMAGSRLRLRAGGGGLRREFLRPLLGIGLPVAGQWFMRVAPILVILAIAGRQGTESSAAYGIGIRLDQFALFACAGWGAAAATAVGQGLGARDPRGAARAVWWAVALGVAWMAAAGAIFHGGAEGLVRIIGRGEEASAPVVDLGAGYLRTVVFGYPAMGIALVLSMALAGAGSVKLALLLEALVLLGVQTPMAIAAAPDGQGGSLDGVWRVIVGTYWLLAIAYAGVFLAGRWKRKVL
jgi:putative MATE family efflux protein